jgi:hypothetical protein
MPSHTAASHKASESRSYHERAPNNNIILSTPTMCRHGSECSVPLTARLSQARAQMHAYSIGNGWPWAAGILSSLGAADQRP